jgi:hypothetical protein
VTIQEVVNILRNILSEVAVLLPAGLTGACDERLSEVCVDCFAVYEVWNATNSSVEERLSK